MLRAPHTALVCALIALATPNAARAETHGINPSFVDTTCAPCKDFFGFANGAWLKTAEIPAAYSAAGASRDLNDRNQEALRQVLEHTAANVSTETDPTLKKLGAFYLSCMDSSRADREGAAPLAEDLKAIDAIQTPADLPHVWARLEVQGTPGPMRFGPEPDREQSSQNIAQVSQGGLRLPERDYYFRADPKSDSLRKDYVAHLGRLFALLGESTDQAQAHAQAVMKLETSLAESSWTRVQLRDPHAVFHKQKVSDLMSLAPAIDWSAYFQGLGVKSLSSPDATIDISIASFVLQLNRLVTSTPIDDWRAYLRSRLLRESAPWLGGRFYGESFWFESRLSGQQIPQPRWKRAAEAVDRGMGEALGKAFVEREFPASSRARMAELVNNLQATLRERIASRTWMSEATKQQAMQKLDAVLKKIGYPDKWRDYSALEIDVNASAIENIRRASAFEARRRLAQIGQPVDRMEWAMTTPTVNAYYNSSRNEIVFPAGILAPPQFDPLADDAVNYGAVGMVIGHEMTHGFDDQGRQFDAEGNLKDWWTADDAKQFKQRAQRVVDQFNGYVAVDTLHVNGRLTLGENIADLGGITIAYYAYQRSLQGKPRPPSIDGFTPEQRFFLGFAQAWRGKIRDEALRQRTLSDPHSPAYWRVNGSLSNLPEFAKTWGCKAGDRMVRDESMRAEIW